MLKPRALRPGDRIAIVAPASPFNRDEFGAGLHELRQLGFEPVHTESIFARDGYLAGSPELRARDLLDAWTDPSVAAVVAARGGYGSVQLLPLLNPGVFRHHPKPFIAFSDNTSLLVWLMQECGLVTFHGPMIEGRLARGAEGYDRDTFTRCLCAAQPAGEITAPQLETLSGGEATGELVGGTLTQLRLSGLLTRVAAIVCNEMPRCEEPGGGVEVRDVVRSVLRDFPGPILFGLPSGHTDGPTVTLPFGVLVRVIGGGRPALVVEEAAVC